MLRLFTGLTLPILLRQRLTLLQGGIDGARWTERENFHITLSFIGDINEGLAEDAHHALSGIRMEPFELELKGTGAFATGKEVYVLWMGVEHSEPLFRLKEKIDRALKTAGVPVEARKYTPHVTMARFSKAADEGEIARFMQGHNLFSGDPWQVDEFTLFQSHLTKNGAAYEAMESYPLTR